MVTAICGLLEVLASRGLLKIHLRPQHTSSERSNFSFEKKSLKINIVSYFFKTLASPNEKTWHDRGGPITQKINHFSLNPDHRRSVEKDMKKKISSLEKGVKFAGNNVTKKNVRPYLISSCL